MAAVMLRCLQSDINEERYSDKGVPTVTSDEQVGIFVFTITFIHYVFLL